MPEGDMVILISYFPFICKYASLFRPSDTNPTEDKLKEMARLVCDSTEHALAAGCMWVGDDIDGVAPVFIIDRAKEIHNDLTLWSANNHSKWFTLDWCVHDSRYVIAIMPIIEQTVNRFRLRHLIEHEELLQDPKVSVLFQPLRFLSAKPSELFNKWSPNASSVKIGLIDPSDVNVEKHAINAEPLWIGPLDVKPNSKWVHDYLKDMKLVSD
jgi:hypothetical protein